MNASESTVRENGLREWLLEHISLKPQQDYKAELANGLTHALGIALAIVAIVMFTVRILRGDVSSGFGAASVVFAVTMLVLYTSSTCYHLLQGPIAKRIARIMDHASIYFLIAGTYTPVMVAIGTTASYAVLVFAWVFTIGGIFFTLAFWGRYGILHVVMYLVMGWMIVAIWRDVVSGVNMPFIRWAIGGGISYTTGTIFYGMQKLPYNHAIWHLFVLSGSVCFFFGIYLELGV